MKKSDGLARAVLICSLILMGAGCGQPEPVKNPPQIENNLPAQPTPVAPSELNPDNLPSPEEPAPPIGTPETPLSTPKSTPTPSTPTTNPKTTTPPINQPTGTPEPTPAPKPVVKTFNMTAKQWAFEPSRITVNQGDTVKISVKSVDVDHGFGLSAFGVDVDLAAGETKTVEFVADKKGTFTFFCSVFCGSGHGSMKGTLVVE